MAGQARPAAVDLAGWLDDVPATSITLMLRTSASRALVLLFLILAAPLGLLLAVLVPLGQVADEPAHILKADSLLHGEWIGHREMGADAAGRQRPREGVIADEALLSVIVSPLRPNDLTPSRVDPSALKRARQIRFGDVPKFFEIGTIASYFPVFYLPAALTLGVCKLLGTSASTGFLAARLCNLLLALAMEAAALTLVRRGRALMFGCLLLPLSLSLAASVNQDGLLIGASALAVACASCVKINQKPSRSVAWWIAVGLIGCVILAKPPYLPMAMLLFLPMRASNEKRLPLEMGWRLGVTATILLITVAWTWLNVHVAAVPIFRGPEEAGPLWLGHRPAIFDGTSMAAQLSVLTARPWRFVTLPVYTIWHHPEIFRQLLDLLGWLNLRLPRALVIGWSVALPCVALADRLKGHPVSRNGGEPLETLLLVSAALLTVILIYLSQYLSFTPVGWDWISGPQGRYLLPLLLLLAVALPPGKYRHSSLFGLLIVPSILAAMGGLWLIPEAIIRFYYSGP